MASAYPFSVLQNSALIFVNVIFFVQIYYIKKKKYDKLENLAYFIIKTSLTHIFFLNARKYSREIAL